jgi:plastocyanin
MTKRILLLAGVALGALLLTACSSSADGGSDSVVDGAVTIVNFSFSPAGTEISVGDTVTWTNDPASVGHTTTSDDGLWNSSLIMAGNTFEHTFTEAGRFTYFCSIHPSMKASITVNG